MRVVEEHVDAAVRAFFSKPWVLLLAARATTKGRREFRRRLSGPVELQCGCAVPVDDLSEDGLAELLVAHGAGESCVLVKDGLVDDEIAALPSALHRVLLAPEGALVSCIPGRLCFLQCDGGKTRVLLNTPHDPQEDRHELDR